MRSRASAATLTLSDPSTNAAQKETNDVKYGVLVPHYGKYCTAERIMKGATRIEELGFDSLWVRDHLIWKPHGMEGTDQTFLDPFITLAAMAGVTKNIELGTAVLIPIRWPLKVAQNFASLSFLSGRKIHAGFGIGSNGQELAAAGFDVKNREPIFIETLEICHQVWDTGTVNWHGEQFTIENVTLAPKPTSEIVTWYGGSTRAAVRRSVQYCEGWIPGRLPFPSFDNRIKYLRELDEAAGKKTKIGAIPVMFLDESREAARSKIDVTALAHSSEGSDRWLKPASGEFEKIEDLEGLLIAGNIDECAEEIAKFASRGVDEFVFDLRLQFDRYEEILDRFGTELLPKLRKL
jgi:alkanesulfonate monooxygenase SsuD/methylene tetrahydromethanopterin reductase-like flavin-dependent oxidoreductase (luciferase family)